MPYSGDVGEDGGGRGIPCSRSSEDLMKLLSSKGKILSCNMHNLTGLYLVEIDMQYTCYTVFLYRI